MTHLGIESYLSKCTMYIYCGSTVALYEIGGVKFDVIRVGLGG